MGPDHCMPMPRRPLTVAIMQRFVHASLQVVATDGDGDLVQLARRNLPGNCGPPGPPTLHPPRAAVLRWGQQEDVDRIMGSVGRPCDLVLMSDIVYGQSAECISPCVDVSLLHDRAHAFRVEVFLFNMQLAASAHASCSATRASTNHWSPNCTAAGSNPGDWERLVHTLKAIGSPVFLQTETFRLEGRYDEYWRYLSEAGFAVHEVERELLNDDLANVRMWVGRSNNSRGTISG